MTRNNLLPVFSLTFICSPAFAEGDAASGKEKFEEACESCHYEDDFVEDPKSVIEAMILAIVNGEIKHRGDFSGLSKKEVANLAAFLAEQ